MKINIIGNDYFNNMKLKLKKGAKKGIIIASTCLFASGLLPGCRENEQSNSASEMINYLNAEVLLDDINDMNIIINDSDCSNSLFDDVCNKLTEDGIRFKTAKNSENIDVDNSTIITLDQQYSCGADTVIFAPYNNTRLGYSDSLALAMQSSLEQNGFLGNYIVCGKTGFREEKDGSVSTSIPTDTEEKLSDDNDISFVTVSFGTHNVNGEWIAKSIEDALARQIYYLNNYDPEPDLIYRAGPSDSIEMIADYFNTNVGALCSQNKITDDISLNSLSIVNPEAKDLDVFKKDSIFYIGEQKTRAY